MKRFRFSALVSVLGGLAWPGFAEPVTLDQVIRMALSESPSLERAEAVLSGSEAGIDAARARRGLQVYFEGQAGISHTDFVQDRIGQSPRQVSLLAEVPLYASGTLQAGMDAARYQADAASHQVSDAREGAVLEATEAFATLWLAERLVEVAAAQAQSLALRNQEVLARYEQGVITMTDVSLSNARLASAQAGLARAESGMRSAEARLARLTGRFGLKPDMSRSPLSLPLGLTEDGAIARALSHNASLAAAKSGRDQADARLAGVRGEFGPRFSVSARLSASEDTYFFFDEPISEAGVFIRFQMPFLTSGLKTATERRAVADRHAATASVRQLELGVVEGVRSLWAERLAQQVELDAARRAEQAAGLAADGARMEYEAGLRMLVDALDADAEFRDAQAARLSAEIMILLSEARLLAMLGHLETSLQGVTAPPVSVAVFSGAS